VSRRPLRLAALAAVAALALSSCNTVGPRVVRSSRVEYSQALADGFNEQMLLNLVRLRYRDTPQFLEVSTLTTEYVLGGSASAAATVGGGETDVGISVSGGYSETPTVSYTPLAGEDVVEKLLTPVEVSTLYLLMRSGWSIERVLRLAVREMRLEAGALLRNAPSADGPTPDYPPHYFDFRLASEELREMQKQGALRVDVFCATADCRPAAQHGDGGGDGGNGNAGVAFEPYLVLAPQGVRADSCLSSGLLLPSAERVYLGLAAGRLDDHGLPDRDLPTGAVQRQLHLYPRSLMAVFYFLSQSVQVPVEHARLVTPTPAESSPPTRCHGELDRWKAEQCPPQPAATPGLDWTDTVLGDLFAVRTSAGEPADAFVRVRYRGQWFYIPDCDLESKTTFALLTQLFSLQSGDPKDRAANVILSLGG
jgi:hypothetical protein